MKRIGFEIHKSGNAFLIFFFHEANDSLFPVLLLPEKHSHGSKRITAAHFQMALAGRWHLLSELNSNTVSLSDLEFYNVSELIFLWLLGRKEKCQQS